MDPYKSKSKIQAMAMKSFRSNERKTTSDRIRNELYEEEVWFFKECILLYSSTIYELLFSCQTQQYTT
jgi:hypothetical protein